MRLRLSLLAVLCCALLGVAASSAGAAAYCLNADSLCSGNPLNIRPATEAGLASAVSSAESNSVPDVIYIGAGTIDIDSLISTTTAPGDSLAIEGVGNGNTNLHFTQPSGVGLDIGGASVNNGISNLNVQIDGAVTTDVRSAVRIDVGRVSGVNFTVDAESDNDYATAGLDLRDGAECQYCTFAVKHDDAIGVLASGSSKITMNEFHDASGADDDTYGIRQAGTGTTTVARSTFTELYRAADVQSGTIDIFDSLIDLGDHAGASGMNVEAPGNSGLSLHGKLDGVTVVGAAPQQRAVYAEASSSNPAETAAAAITNSLLLFTGSPLPSAVRCVDDGSASGSVVVTYTFAEAGTPSSSGCSSSVLGNIEVGSHTPQELFVNWDAGDLRLKQDAPVIDLGDPSVNNSGGRLDAIGAKRVADPFGTGTERIDMGGIEYQDYPPDKPTVGASATTVEVGTAINFTASSIDGNDDPVTYSWDFSDGSISSEQNPTHTFTKDGTYVVQVRALAGGSMSEVGEVEITVNAKAKTDCCSAGAGYTNNFVYNKTSGPLKPPKSGKLKNGFRVSTKKPKSGGYIPVTANAKMAIKLSFEKPRGGYLVDGACRAKQGKTGSTKRCSLPLKGTQTIELPAGTSYLIFGGKWNKRALPSGKYTLIGVDPNPAAPAAEHKAAVTYTAKQGKTGKTK